MPTSIDKRILMASQHGMEQGLDPSVPCWMQTTPVCVLIGLLRSKPCSILCWLAMSIVLSILMGMVLEPTLMRNALCTLFYSAPYLVLLSPSKCSAARYSARLVFCIFLNMAISAMLTESLNLS